VAKDIVISEIDLNKTLQDLADFISKTKPVKPAPAGFYWAPIVHPKLIGDYIHQDIEWIAKPL
jgi:hypothetical protein